MYPIGTNCNPCEQNKCGSCVGDRLQSYDYLTNAKDHCKCARAGHDNLTNTIPIRGVKSLLGRSKIKDEDGPTDNTHEVEEEIEVD